MSEISLKGVARQHGGITGDFSVIDNIFGVPLVPAPVSLRDKLETMASQQISFNVAECVFGWTAAFEQIWTHIRVRIRLNPDADVTTATMSNLRTRWRNGIENVWNNQWGCGRSGELNCALTFEVLWVNNNFHHAVRVNTGQKCTNASGNAVRCPTNMGRWHTNDSGNVAAHEFGHMLGNPDEYPDTTTPCPNRNPVSTGTIMDNNSANVPSRMMTQFAGNIGSSVLSI